MEERERKNFMLSKESNSEEELVRNWVGSKRGPPENEKRIEFNRMQVFIALSGFL